MEFAKGGIGVGKEADFKAVKVKYKSMYIFPDEDELEEKAKKKFRGKAVYYMETELGKIGEGEWTEKVEGLAKKYDEQNIIVSLEKYCRNELPWIKHKKQIADQIEDIEERKLKMAKYEESVKEEALGLYANRIFENESWVGKEIFENVYLRGKGTYQISMF